MIIIHKGYFKGDLFMNKAEIRKIKKGIELLELVLGDLNRNEREILNNLRRDSFHHIFYDGNRLDELFLAIIPTEQIEDITRVLLIIKTAYAGGNGEIQSQYGRILNRDLKAMLEIFLDNLKSALVQYGFNIFYSWQTELTSKTNRNFIQSSLEKAIKSASIKSQLPLRLDKDTINREGSPDIVQTILEKIDECLLFVADISITGEYESCNKEKRYSPNSNVLYELGYAHGVLGESNIIMIFNEATGKIEDLPFDLRGRRIMKYFLNEETVQNEKDETKRQLICHLEHAIIHAVNSNLK